MVSQRGDIVWATVGEKEAKGVEQFKRRPWVVVSSNEINKKFELVIAVPLSTAVAKVNRQHRIRIAASEVIRDPLASQPLDHVDRVALTEQVRVLGSQRIETPRAGHLSGAALASVEAGLAFVLDMPT